MSGGVAQPRVEPVRRGADILLTALAPAVWGSTYYVTTEFLSQGYPLTVAALRALPVGLLLLLIVRRLPGTAWLVRVTVLGALNFTVFWWLLFEAAYRLPGGVVATLGATQARTFTAWQLTAGGLMLTPLALLLEPSLPPVEARHVGGMLYLGLIGAAATYALWFRGIARLEPSAVSMLGMMSPVTAVALGWALLGQTLDPLQVAGAATVLAAVWLGQQARPATSGAGHTRRPI